MTPAQPVQPSALSSHSWLGSHGLDGLRAGGPARGLAAEGQGEGCRFASCSGFFWQFSCGGDYTSSAGKIGYKTYILFGVLNAANAIIVWCFYSGDRFDNHLKPSYSPITSRWIGAVDISFANCVGTLCGERPSSEEQTGGKISCQTKKITMLAMTRM
jgi:hypothetical protein